MPHAIYLCDLEHGYLELIDAVTTRGEPVAPRGIKTLELEDAQLVVADIHKSAPVGLGRKLSSKILAAEMMQWLGGFSDLVQLNDVSGGRFAEYSDDDITLYGAYGPRTYSGFFRAINLLSKDPNTRQAVVPIWHPDEATTTRDLPCTLSWSFRIRNGHLHMTTTMRSNDVWTGVAYDIPIMCRIGDLVAWALGSHMRLEGYTHHAQSLHLYERDREAAASLEHWPGKIPKRPPLMTYGIDVALEEWILAGKFDARHRTNPTERWKFVLQLAEIASGHRKKPLLLNLPPGFQWAAEQLEGSATYPHFCEKCRYWLPQEELLCVR